MKQFLQEIMKKKIIIGTLNAWSEVRLDKRISILAYYILDWLTSSEQWEKLVMDLPSSVDDSQIFVMYDAFLRKIISQIFLGEFMLTLKKLLNIEDLRRHISGPHITFWTFSAVSGVYHAWQSFNNYVDKKKRKGLVESLCLVTQQREGIM